MQKNRMIVVENQSQEIGRIQLTPNQEWTVAFVRQKVEMMTGPERVKLMQLAKVEGTEGSYATLESITLEKAVAIGNGVIYIELDPESASSSSTDVIEHAEIVQEVIDPKDKEDDSSSEEDDSSDDELDDQVPDADFAEPMDAMTIFCEVFKDDAEYVEFIEFLIVKKKTKCSLDSNRVLEIETQVVERLPPFEVAYVLRTLGVKKAKFLRKKGFTRFAYVMKKSKHMRQVWRKRSKMLKKRGFNHRHGGLPFARGPPPHVAAGGHPRGPPPHIVAGGHPRGPPSHFAAGGHPHGPPPHVAAGGHPHGPPPHIAAGGHPHGPPPHIAAGGHPRGPPPHVAAGGHPRGPPPHVAAGGRHQGPYEHHQYGPPPHIRGGYGRGPGFGPYDRMPSHVMAGGEVGYA